ncbi:MAG: hypothetical protein IID13_06730 [Candidatus Marinimicrobia bacterium]|nr:hypothetical protein [Candidatus Neomarinimicrobiota bacterium]
MKTGVLIFLAGLLLIGQLPAQLAEGEYWYSGTARLLPEGRKVSGLFEPLRYGRSERLEWSLNPVLALVIPNMAVKLARNELGGWQRAWRISGHYPTLLLRTLTREGTAGLLAPDPTIPQVPHLLFVRGEVLLSRRMGTGTLVTLKGGLALALKAGEFDARHTIDLPVIYPRMAAYRNGYQFNLGIDLLQELPVIKRLWVDADLFITPGFDRPLAFEHKGLTVLSRKGRLGLLVGYKLTWGDYPFGAQWHLLPLVDLQWTRQRKGPE